MSVIRYRFFSSKDYDTLSFDGPSLHVWEVKDEIIMAKKLQKFVDFDLILTNAQTNEEYLDENKVIPKNTSLIVKRVPRAASSAATRQFHQSRSQQHQHQQQQQQTSSLPKSYSLVNKASDQDNINAAKTVIEDSASRLAASTTSLESLMHNKNHEEELKLQAMVKASAEEWNKQLDIHDTFSQERFTTRQSSYPPGQGQNAKATPPPYYVCYRCGDKGHYIVDCPIMLANPNDLTRIKRVTGIPKSFLKPVNDVENAGTSKALLKKTMISYDGSKVIFTPNTSEWQKFSSMAVLANKEVERMASADEEDHDYPHDSSDVGHAGPAASKDEINPLPAPLLKDIPPSVNTKPQPDVQESSKSASFQNKTVPESVPDLGQPVKRRAAFSRLPPPIPKKSKQ